MRSRSRASSRGDRPEPRRRRLTARGVGGRWSVILSARPGFKTCRECGREKPLAAFYANPRNRDGRGSWCRACTKRRYTGTANLAWRRARERERFATDPLFRRKALSRGRQRKARLRGASAIPVDAVAIGRRDGMRCHLCGRRIALKDFTLDHLIPIVDGGPHTPSNVAAAHRSCNSRRGAGRIPAQLLLEIA